ncbi:MAG: hypothetical protein AB2A00_03395 [Myxococcota bacterium]
MTTTLSALDELKDLTSPYDAKGRTFLSKTYTFLVNVTVPRIAARAAKCGYDNAEHQEGKELHAVASGLKRPLVHFLSEAERKVAAGDGKLRAIIKKTDDDENTWFPRTRSAIQRFVHADHRQAVEEAFFADLAQQPEGPAVIDSMERYLERLDGLKNSDKPGAKEAFASLQKKGLTDAEIARIKDQIAKAKELVVIPAPPVDEEEQRKAAAAQLEAFDKLKRWYGDWADTLRQELPHNDLVRLGLRAQKGGRAAAAGKDEDTDELVPA